MGSISGRGRSADGTVGSGLIAFRVALYVRRADSGDVGGSSGERSPSEWHDVFSSNKETL